MYIWTCLAVQKHQKCVRRRWLAIERTHAMIVMGFQRLTSLTKFLKAKTANLHPDPRSFLVFSHVHEVVQQMVWIDRRWFLVSDFSWERAFRV